MKHRSRWLGGLTGVGLILATSTAVFGYAGQVAGTVTVTTGPVVCTAPVAVSATVLETGTGSPIEGQLVTFAFTASQTGDRFTSVTATTNAMGVASTTVSLACTPGTRTIVAVADDVRGEAVLGLTLTPAPARPASGLPNTSTGGAEMPALLAALVAAASGGILLRRYSLSHR